MRVVTLLNRRLGNARSKHFSLEENTIEVARKQSITDLTNGSDARSTGLYHLDIQPFNIVFIFTNPWAKSSQGVISVTAEEKEDLWNYIYKLLKSKNNRGKSEGGSYLVYALLDYVVWGVCSVQRRWIRTWGFCSASRRTSSMWRRTSLTPRRYTELEVVLYLTHSRCCCRANWMPSRIGWGMAIGVSVQIKPILGIIETFQTDPTCSHRVSVYLNDVKDHIQQLLNDIQYCSNRSSNVYSLVESVHNKRQERILFILTVITTIFTPISFLAGVYGMNFEYMPVGVFGWCDV